MQIAPPNIAWAASDGLEYKPSWKRDAAFINAEHAEIWEKTKHLPGWQDPEDSQKLYELGYYNGQVILEIGVFGGRSAAVELRGALAAGLEAPPQYYGVDIDLGFLGRSLESVESAKVAEHCLFYHGNLKQFLADLPIVPTMIFVDGDHEYAGCLDDLRTLTGFVAPGTPVLCHDYHAIEGVRRAVDEIVATGFFKNLGLFAGSILLVSTDACTGSPRALTWETFQSTRRNLLARYDTALRSGATAGHHTDVTTLVKGAHAELRQRPAGLCGHAAWPWFAQSALPLPATLPDGKPWPRISIITPSFNQGEFIEQTILSVANQGYPNVEHIIMDGGSTDQTVAILQKHSAHLAHWTSGKDRGQSSAINNGFAKATGEIVTWLNSDDRLAPGALASAALALHYSGADIVAGIVQLFRDDVIFAQHLTSCPDGVLPLDELADIENRWFAGQFFYQPEVLFKRDLLLKVGGGLSEELFWNLDYDLWFRFAQAGAKLKVIGRPIAQFRVHDEQKTNDEKGFKKELRELLQRLRPGQAVPPPSATPPKKRLRIAMLNDIGFRYGAGLGHSRIAQALALGGHEVIPIAIGSDNLNAQQKEKPFADKIVPRIRKAAPDVVLVGNLHGAGLGGGTLAAVADAFPTVFVMHDLWLLTGRCAYRGTCENNLTGCDASCPTPTEHPQLQPDQIAAAWQEKMSLLKSSRQFAIASNSQWTLGQVASLAQELKAPSNAPINHPVPIRLGVPLEIFYPRDPMVCREILGLPQDKFIILFSCSSIADERKGIQHLIDAIKKLDLPDLLPVAIGRHDPKSPIDLPNLVCVGYLTDAFHQAMLYSAADLFVGPSLDEAFGQVFIEAAACGTPSVAYPVGGVPEAVRDGISGRLATNVSPNALAAAIEELYMNPIFRRNLGVWGRIWVENEFSIARSLHSLTFALRAALESTGSGLIHKIQLADAPVPVSSPAILFEELGYASKTELPPPQTRNFTVGSDYPFARREFERSLLKYYSSKLEDFRHRPLPWYLYPGAWLARINREEARKAVARSGKTRSS